MRKYIIIYNNKLSELKTEVDVYLNLGYTKQGIIGVNDTDNGAEYYQALIK